MPWWRERPTTEEIVILTVWKKDFFIITEKACFINTSQNYLQTLQFDEKHSQGLNKSI